MRSLNYRVWNKETGNIEEYPNLLKPVKLVPVEKKK
jgi:hypothetical protein